MQNKGLLYWILNSDKQPQYINSSNHVETGIGVTKTDGTTPAHLTNSPDGWNETLVKWGRNNKYLGLFREFSVPLNFVKDGAKILRNAMWKKGMEAIMYLAISKLNRTAFPDVYEQWYTGELDFSKYKQTNNGVDINIMEGGLSKLLKSNEGITYEIPINTDAERFSLYLDGMPFKNIVEWTIFGDQEIVFDSTLIGCGIISTEGTSQGIIVQDGPVAALPFVPTADTEIVRVVNKTVTMNLTTNIKFKMQAAGSLEFRYHVYDKDGVIVSSNIISILTAYSNGQTVDINNTQSIVLLDGHKIYIEDLAGVHHTILGGSIILDYNVTFSATLCECLTWMRLFEKLTEKLTNGKFGCRSSFLTSLTGNKAVTSGQAIRAYQGDAVIKTSMNDFFRACQHWGCGLGIENNELILERHEYFFGSSTAIALGEVNEIEFSVAEDLVFNHIKVGYINQNYDKVNGLYEFNVTQNYGTPHTRITKELDLVNPYRADMVGIEITRLDLYGKTTTDNKADNDTFMMDVIKGTDYNYYEGSFTTEVNTGSYYVLIPSVLFQLANGETITFDGNDYTVVNTSYLIAGYTYIQVAEVLVAGSFSEAISVYDADVYKLNRPAYSAITGLLFPDEAFNTELSPKHSLINNGAYIHSVLDLQDSGQLKFNSGEKNSLLSTTLAGVTVAENSDITIYDLPGKLFKPYYVSFKTDVNNNLQQIMRDTPYDRVSFTYKGNTYTGFMWDVGTAPATNDAQTWKLLMCPDNDLTKLI